MLHVIYLEARNIEYYESGMVKKGKLLLDSKIDGITFKRGEWISFHENGRVKEGYLAKNANINEIGSERDEGRDCYLFHIIDNVIPTTFFSKIKKMFKR